MFKKSLLALSVAALSSSAMAGTIYSSVTQTVLTATEVGTDLKVGSSAAAGTADITADDCAAIATLMTVTPTGVALLDGAGTLDDIATLQNNVGIYSGTNVAGSVVGTGTGETCDVTLATTASSSTDKSPVEQTGTISVGAAIVAGAGGYRQEDTITINFAGAKIKPAIIPTLSTTAAGGATFELLDITDTTVRFTVKSGSGDVPANAIVTLAGASLDTTGLTTGTKVSIDTFATNTSGTKYDVIGATEIHELVPQYSAKVDHKFNGIIDVQSERKVLVAVDDSANAGTGRNESIQEDTLFIDVNRDTTVNHVVSTDVTFTINGDFSWLSAAADATTNGTSATAAEILAYLNATGSLSLDDGATFQAVTAASLNAAMDTLTITDAVAGGGTAEDDYAIRFIVPAQAAANAQVLETQTYKVSVSSSNGAAAPNTITMNAATDLDAGAWTLNGSVVTIPYMPFDDNTAVIMRHTNTGVQTGDMSVRYMLEGVSSDWEEAGVIGTSSRGVQNIRDLVINAIKDASNADSGKVAIEITTNVPKDDVTVYAGFRVKDENDRGFVGTYGKRGSTAAN